MKTLKTTNCILCGKEAVVWTGYVSAQNDVKIVAGLCEEHKKTDVPNGLPYDNKLMGDCIPLFPS